MVLINPISTISQFASQLPSDNTETVNQTIQQIEILLVIEDVDVPTSNTPNCC